MTKYSITRRLPAVWKYLTVRLTVTAFLSICCFAGLRLNAQASATASDDGALQIGGLFSFANSSYTLDALNGGSIKGAGAYVTFNFNPHYGVEAEFHQLNDSNPAVGIYERTYEIGPRYVREYGRFAPYVKLMLGRGVFNYPSVTGQPNGPAAANLAYNVLAAGAGVDYQLLVFLNIRADYEYQHWQNFPQSGLSPGIFSVGAAYRFH